MHALLIWLPTAQAGWSVSPESGSPPAASLSAIDQLIDGCPIDHGDWIARYSGGELVRLGPVASPDAKDGALESCLKAGLAARPVDGDVLLRVHWADPVADVWEGKVLGVLNQVVGPQPHGGCATLRFPIDAKGTLGEPTLIQTSGDEARDQTVLRSVNAYQEPLPPLPERLSPVYGEHVDLCVGGIQ